MRYFLTDQGNILVVDASRQFFQTPTGEFLRPCSNGELEYLLSLDLIEFAPIANFKLSLEKNQEFPQWHHLISVLKESDYEKYKPETANNGGDYAFFTYRHVFFSRKHNGQLKIGYIDEIQSSADFTITWDGKFQSDNTQIEFLNCVDQLYPVFNFQAIENGVRVYKVLEPIEKYLEICPIESIFAMEHVEIPDNQMAEIRYTPIFTPENIKELTNKLQKIGDLPTKKRR